MRKTQKNANKLELPVWKVVTTAFRWCSPLENQTWICSTAWRSPSPRTCGAASPSWSPLPAARRFPRPSCFSATSCPNASRRSFWFCRSNVRGRRVAETKCRELDQARVQAQGQSGAKTFWSRLACRRPACPCPRERSRNTAASPPPRTDDDRWTSDFVNEVSEPWQGCPNVDEDPTHSLCVASN